MFLYCCMCSLVKYQFVVHSSVSCESIGNFFALCVMFVACTLIEHEMNKAKYFIVEYVEYIPFIPSLEGNGNIIYLYICINEECRTVQSLTNNRAVSVKNVFPLIISKCSHLQCVLLCGFL